MASRKIDRRLVVELYRSGMPGTAIAATAGVIKQRVYHVLANAGFRRPGKKDGLPPGLQRRGAVIVAHQGKKYLGTFQTVGQAQAARLAAQRDQRRAVSA